MLVKSPTVVRRQTLRKSQWWKGQRFAATPETDESSFKFGMGWMERRYIFHLYITREVANGWEGVDGAAVYSAITRGELTER